MTAHMDVIGVCRRAMEWDEALKTYRCGLHVDCVHSATMRAPSPVKCFFDVVSNTDAR